MRNNANNPNPFSNSLQTKKSNIAEKAAMTTLETKHTIQPVSTRVKTPHIQNIPANDIKASLNYEDFDNKGKISNLPSKNETYTFKGYGGSILPLADYGIRTSFYVEGNAIKINNNLLSVSASAKGDHSNLLSGYITVTQNGKIYSKQKLEKDSNGYIYRSGGPIPIGETIVDLPKEGNYEVSIDVIGDIYETGSHFPTSFNKKIIIEK